MTRGAFAPLVIVESRSNYEQVALPSEVAGLKVQDAVNTVTLFCCTVKVADVNAMSVIVADQLPFGQPACCGVGCAGACVTTLNETLPFLTWLDGIAVLPVTLTEAGFWPGAWFPPAFAQTAVGFAVALSVASRSPFPRPVREAFSVSVSPLSVNVGLPCLKCTLAASALVIDRAETSAAAARIKNLRECRIRFPS
jgi:hypothetical protein